MTVRQLYKKAAEGINEDDYIEERNDAFDEELRDTFCTSMDTITEDDIMGFLDSFDFPDFEDWATAKIESDVDSYYDSKYQEYKDREIE